MIDEPTSTDATTGPVCPWCSEPLLAADVDHCPRCGATMTAEQEPVIPGVTTIQPEILAKQARAAKPKRGGLMSLFVGREDEQPNVQQPTEAELPALAQPSVEVRREMLRIELEAAGVLPPEEPAAESAAGSEPTAVDQPTAVDEPAVEEPQGAHLESRRT